MARLQVIALVALVLLVPAGTGAQILLRWDGGQASVPTVPTGVQVLRLPWAAATPDSGGAAFQLTVNDAIGALGLGRGMDLAAQAPIWGGGAWDNKEAVFDGDPATSWANPGYICASIRNGCDDIYASPGTNDIDLGARFFIERVIIRSGLSDPSGTVRDFRIHLAGELPPPLWCCAPFRPVVAEVRDNREQVREILLPTPQRARFVQVAVGEREEGWEIHDIEIYGRGFVEEAAYVSNIIALDRPMAWGEMRWSGAKGEDASVLIQTRTGTDPDPLLYWRFTGLAEQKEEVSRTVYAGLSLGEKAGASYDRANWSPWSAPYEFADSSGTPVVSPGPRAFVQLRIDFVPSETDGGRIDYLELQAATPAATELLGEVWPVESEIGQWQRYTYFVFSSIDDDDTGFDRLEISSLSQLGAVLDVRISDEPVPFDVLEADAHRFVIDLPAMGPEDSGAILELDFDARVLRYGTSFDGRVWDSGQSLPTPQSINPGDATGEYEGNLTSVTTPVRNRNLLAVAISPSVLTPNGDGENDITVLAYEILDITGPATVRVEVLDLSGRRLRQLHDASQGMGLYKRRWDGRDDAGRLVPPGIYLARIALTADERSDTRVQVLHVAY